MANHNQLPKKGASALLRELAAIEPESLHENDTRRQDTLKLCKQLIATLENPIDVAVDMVFTPFIPTAVRTAVDLQLFKPLSESTGSMTTSQLAQTSGGEVLLVSRILRLLESINFVASPGPDLWSPTPVTHAMALDGVAAGHRFVWDMLVCANVQLPQYLQQVGHRSPAEPTSGVFQYAHQTESNVFDYMSQVRKDRLSDFHLFMGNTMGAKTYWVDWYPVTSHVLEDYDESTTLIVDVGAGKGHDIQAFATRYPEITGRLVLQDLPEALDAVPQDLDKRIQLQAQDFFAPNQVIGARVYFLHHILHDWSDKYALRILENIVKGMKPGYSKLLIHDLILPDSGVSPYQARFDMVMMTFAGGMERSRSQWKALLDEAGLEIVEFSHGPDGDDADGIIEAVLMNQAKT